MEEKMKKRKKFKNRKTDRKNWIKETREKG